MGTRNWTTAQRAAIADESGTLLVSAAAGSGKTAVLVERAVRLISRENSPVSADRLLILTFTNAAADELRSRIALRLEEVVAQRGGAALRRQQMLLKRAFIGTIDAFCQQLVKEHFTLLDIPPDVSVGDTALLEQLAQAAMDETMEEMYMDADFAAFALLYGRARSDAPAEAAVRQLYDFTLSLPEPDTQLERWAEMYAGEQAPGETVWGKELLDYANQALQAAEKLASEAEKTAEMDEQLEGYLPVLGGDVEGISAIRKALARADWDGASRAVQTFYFAPLKPVRGYEGEAKDVVQSLRKLVKKIIAELEKYCFVCSVEEYQQDVAMARPMITALCRAAALYGEKLYAAKLEERVLYFPDFEHLALNLLRDKNGRRTQAAQRISGRYDAVMVDEYQDTNELQSALYACLGNAEGSNLFYVGDVKQSVYRFRKANPEIFVQKKQEWAAYGSGESPAVITLGHNFRSGGGVIAGVNHIFGMLMSRRLGEVDYTDEEKLIQGSEGGERAGFELRLLADPENRGDADYVAQRIADMVQQEYPVREGEGTRACAYGDFCILLRARGKMPLYLAALEARGIPVASDATEDLLVTPEVLPLTAALAAIDNPGDEIRLAGALLGPLFRFSPDEVTRLRAAAPSGSLWGALSSSGVPKVQEFVKTMQFYRALAGEMPAGRLCEEIVERTGYMSALGAMENGAARKENLLAFIGWASGVSESGRGGLSGFLRLLEGGRGPSGGAFKNLPGHVSLLTIHKSKGLEFPVCILADAGHTFNRGDLDARVPMHAGLGVGMWLRAGDQLYPTLPARAVRRCIEREAQSEEMRILYVALTRAKERMIITYPHKDPAALLAARAIENTGEEGGAYLHSLSRKAGDWIVSAALRHPDAEPLRAFMQGVPPAKRDDAAQFIMSVEQVSEARRVPMKTFALTAAPDAALVETLVNGFGKALPRAPLSKLPMKVSVSAIAKPDAAPLRRRPSFMFESGLTAAEKGTIQHNFMQYADYTAATEDLEGEIARLEQEGFIEEGSGARIDRVGIEVFLHSPLAERMRSAKTLLREYDFITAMPAGVLEPDLPLELAQEQVLVQGIADAVIVNDDAVEIVDYKTDRGKTAQQLVRQYEKQLQLYRVAIEKRLGRPACRLTLWSFALAQEVEVGLA